MLNKLITLSFILLISVAQAQVEEQRKYVFANPSESTIQTINGGGILDGLTVKKHSDFTYLDMYLDTENLALLKNKMSLRIRSRYLPGVQGASGIQLKSEMLKPGDIRMEIDEPELDYMSVFYNGQTLSLQTVINELFDRFLKIIQTNESLPFEDKELQDNVSIVRAWLAFKINSAIGPFQKLKHLVNDPADLATLRPILIGKSVRGRSHVYIDREATALDLRNFPASQMDQLETAEELRGPRYIWTMETSFDQAVFYSLEIDGKHNIKEYEVENKYRPLDQGRELIKRFEGNLVEDMGAETNLESKYLQSMRAIFNY